MPERSTPCCPTCASDASVHAKLLLVDRSAACACYLSVEQLKPDIVQPGVLQQFIAGFYCDGCGLGFLPDDLRKPREQGWMLLADGWHLVGSDGSLGPPRARPA